jgi:hypothetical protein
VRPEKVYAIPSAMAAKKSDRSDMAVPLIALTASAACNMAAASPA